MKKIYLLSLAFSTIFFLGLNAQCFEDSHSPFKNQGWLSCNTSQSPNFDRGNSHWIMYDLGHKYTIDSLQVWNYNEWGETGSGAKRIIVDYSLDKLSWQSAGTYNITKAPGSWKYQTDNIVDLNNATGRYFLVTVLEAWDVNASCTGLSEIKFSVGISTSTEDALTDSEWSLSPNPAIENITIDLNEIGSVDQIMVTNSIGQVVKRIDNSLESKIHLDIIDLNSGVYYVSIIKDGLAQNKAFVKMSLR